MNTALAIVAGLAGLAAGRWALRRAGPHRARLDAAGRQAERSALPLLAGVCLVAYALYRPWLVGLLLAVVWVPLVTPATLRLLGSRRAHQVFRTAWRLACGGGVGLMAALVLLPAREDDPLEELILKAFLVLLATGIVGGLGALITAGGPRPAAPPASTGTSVGAVLGLLCAALLAGEGLLRAAGGIPPAWVPARACIPDERLSQLLLSAAQKRVAEGRLGGSFAFDQALAAFGRPAAPALQWIAYRRPLVPLLSSPEPRTRCAAAYALGERREKWTAPRLALLLSDPERDVRCAAARALGKIGDRRAVPALMARIGSPDTPPDWEMAQALALLAPESAPRLVAPYLEDGRALVRVGAVGALGASGQAGALPLLVKAARDPDPRVRRIAAAAIATDDGIRAGPAPDPRAIAALAGLRHDPYQEVCRTADDALSCMGVTR